MMASPQPDSSYDDIRAYLYVGDITMNRNRTGAISVLHLCYWILAFSVVKQER
jgi:hypothetical protein